MIRGLFTSALGMTTQMQRMDVVSNNIANVDTTGFKRESVASQSFAERMAQRINDPAAIEIFPMLSLFRDTPIGPMSPGVFIDEVFTDFSNGHLQQTSNALDIALVGQGFFSIDVDGEEMFTRDGFFTMASDGTLVTANGDLVLGLNGAIQLPNGTIVIDDAGSVFVNDLYIDTLRIVEFTNPQSLRQAGHNLFRTTAASEEAEAGFVGLVRQGFLEGSNVQAVREMVELISLSRAYEANSRILQMQDETLGRAVNEIARRG